MRVLVVDDETFVLETLGRFIGKIGHEPVLAANGTAAVALYKERRPDLVFLDIVLPDKKGDIVFNEIKAYDGNANIILMTGCSDEYVQAKKLMAKECLMKPIDIMKIKELIEAFGPRSSAS